MHKYYIVYIHTCTYIYYLLFKLIKTYYSGDPDYDYAGV